MKKIYLSLTLVCISFLGFSQAEEFKIDFEGDNPLSNLPTGVKHIHSSGDVTFLDGTTQTITTGNSEVIEESDNKVLSMDYLGHLIFDETAIGTGSFTIAGYYDAYGNTVQWMGFITIAGYDTADSTWKNYKIAHQYANGTLNGLNMAVSAANGLPTNATGLNHFALTFDAITGLYNFYKNGELKSTSSSSEKSVATFTDKKIYLGYKGGAQNATDATFDTHAIGSGKNKDLKKKVDDITVFKRAISEAEAATLYTDGTLSLAVDIITKESFSAYPNPVKDYLYFSNDNITSVSIYNQLGSQISAQEYNEGVDMINLTQGVYFVKCMNAQGIELTTIRVVKQ